MYKYELWFKRKIMINFSGFIFLALSFLPATLFAADMTVPKVNVPPGVVAELKRIENSFEIGLGQDCSNDRCFSRGCVYLSHETVDKPRSGSLPGLGDPEAGPGSVGAQEHLTGARCEFAVESTVASKDLGILIKRLEGRLSRGYLVLSVEAKALPPLPFSLRQTPTPAPTAIAATTPLANNAQNTPPHALPAPEWSVQIAMRELWNALLPHFSWMIALFLTTLAAMILMWSWRRVGKQSLEEKLLAASLAEPDSKQDEVASTQKSDQDLRPKQDTIEAKEKEVTTLHPDCAAWKQKFAADPDSFVRLLSHWLREKEFSNLAKLSMIFSGVPELIRAQSALTSQARGFAAYLAAQENDALLPSDDDFFAALQRADTIAGVLNSEDAQLMRRLGTEFGSAEMAALIGYFPDHIAGILMAEGPSAVLNESVSLIPTLKRISLAESLLTSNRVSDAEFKIALNGLKSIFIENKIPQFPEMPKATLNYGRMFGAERVLSALFPRMSRDERKKIVDAVKSKFSDALPAWTSDIFFPEMLLSFSSDLRNGFLLQVEPREIALFLSSCQEKTHLSILRDLPESLKNVVKSYGTSHDDSVLLSEINLKISALVRKECSRGTVSIEQLLIS